MHPIALPSQMTSQGFEELIRQFDMQWHVTNDVTTAIQELQVKQRYRDASLPVRTDELSFDDELQLVRRIVQLRSTPTSRCSSADACTD
jgi:hypothetical protein